MQNINQIKIIKMTNFKKDLEVKKTANFKLTESEVNVLLGALYSRFTTEQLEENPKSVAFGLVEKLYNAKDTIKANK